MVTVKRSMGNKRPGAVWLAIAMTTLATALTPALAAAQPI
jgi:hypothetical protein